jgi:hypothetical protein
LSLCLTKLQKVVYSPKVGKVREEIIKGVIASCKILKNSEGEMTPPSIYTAGDYIGLTK